MFTKIPYLLISVCILLFVCNSCSEEPEKDLDNVNIGVNEIDLIDHLQLDSGEIKVFTMPAPLQVSTLLKTSNHQYNKELLIPVGNNTDGSFFTEAVSLGMLTVDLGYETVFEHQDVCEKYVSDINKKMNSLNIESVIGERFAERFKNNRGNQDSLFQIILENYRDAHEYFHKNAREEVGMLILTGAFIEGAYFATQAEMEHTDLDFDNLIIQQKLYLENVILLLEVFTNDPDYNKLYNSLLEVQKVMESVEINYSEKTQSHVLRRPLFDNQKEEIKLIIEKIRNEIVFD